MERLFALLPPQDVIDAEEFLAASIMLFAQYPIEVMSKAVFEIPQRSDRPTLRLMRQVLDEILAPIERECERKRASEGRRLEAPHPRKRSSEEQARIDAQVAAVRKQLGIPEGVARRKGAAWT